MMKSGFSYLKLTAVVAVLATALIPSVRSSTATSQPAVPTAAADVSNEDRVIARYFDDLVAYDKQSAQLGKKATLVNADLDPVARRSDDLKGRLSELQNSIREIVKKLKAANEWDDLDATTAAKITDRASNTFFKQTSFKQLLEDSSNGLTSHSNELSTPLANLRKKLTSRYGNDADVQFVRASYVAPAPMAFVSPKCSVGRVRLGLISHLGGHASSGTLDTVSCACNPGIGLGTGVACSSLTN